MDEGVVGVVVAEHRQPFLDHGVHGSDVGLRRPITQPQLGLPRLEDPAIDELPEPGEVLACEGQGTVGVGVVKRREGLGEPGQIPLGHAGLVPVGVDALPVDRAEHGARVVRVEEGARAVVDGLAGDGDVVGVHHPVHEPGAQPRRDEARLRIGDGIEQGQRALGLGQGEHVRVVPGGGMVDETLDDVVSAMRPSELKRTDAQMTRRHPHQDRAGQRPLALDAAASGDDRQRAGGRDAQGVHGLGDQVLAQHRAERGEAVAAAGEGGRAGTLEMDVAEIAVAVGDLAEEQRAAVTEDGHELPELVARIRLRYRAVGGGS